MGLQQGLQGKGGRTVTPVSPTPSHTCVAGGASHTHLEVGLAQDAGQLGGRAVLPRQVPDVPQDVLHQLQVVPPHRLQLRLLQPLVRLGGPWRGLGTPLAGNTPWHGAGVWHGPVCTHT